MIFALFALNMTYGYFTTERTKRQITGLFGQYVPSEVVDEMSKNPEQVSMEGESREMSILFSDVRGFTTISEGLDPRDLALLMNEFLTPLSRVIYSHRGTIDKYMGDCIMAFWGAPLPDTRHAYYAVLSGLEMQKTLRDLQPHFKERGWPPIRVGVGINTGRVSVGNMGSEVRVAYTVMGDAVNLASRLEGITKEYGAACWWVKRPKTQPRNSSIASWIWCASKGKTSRLRSLNRSAWSARSGRRSLRKTSCSSKRSECTASRNGTRPSCNCLTC